MHNRRWTSEAEFLGGMEIVVNLQMFFPVTGFYQFPTVTSGFQILFWTQNPPLATAYRFESGHRHQKREPRPGVLFFGIQGGRTRTHVNATVRWTVATRRFRRVLHSVLESGRRHHKKYPLIDIFSCFGYFFAFYFPDFSKKQESKRGYIYWYYI